MIKLHQLKPKTLLKPKKRVGRGGKRGTYSGKGQKGQRSRSGARLQPIIRPMIKRYPKKRGYRFSPVKDKSLPINLSVLERFFNDGEKVNLKTLKERNIIKNTKSVSNVKVKILARGKLTKKITIENLATSKAAQEKIIEAGGKVI